MKVKTAFHLANSSVVAGLEYVYAESSALPPKYLAPPYMVRKTSFVIDLASRCYLFKKLSKQEEKNAI